MSAPRGPSAAPRARAHTLPPHARAPRALLSSAGPPRRPRKLRPGRRQGPDAPLLPSPPPHKETEAPPAPTSSRSLWTAGTPGRTRGTYPELQPPGSRRGAADVGMLAALMAPAVEGAPRRGPEVARGRLGARRGAGLEGR